jgi:hypothetical protein
MLNCYCNYLSSKKAKKSLLYFRLDYNAVPDTLTVVPSILEAHDIIEMEEIERDLGFKKITSMNFIATQKKLYVLKIVLLVFF